MDNEKDFTRIIPNEVILIGKLRDDKDVTPIDVNMSDEEKITAVLAKYKFTRDTNPSEAAKAVGFMSGKFFHIQMGDPGGEYITLPNGKKVKRSRKTTKPGWSTIFQSSRATTFDDIKEELLVKRVELVGGDPNNGKLRLREFALMGFWDEFPLGFAYTPHFYDPRQGGKLVPLMSHPKLPDGTYDKKGVKAISKTGRHFVFEDEIHNLEGMRQDFRDNVEKQGWKLTVADNTKPVPATDTGAPPALKDTPEPPTPTADQEP